MLCKNTSKPPYKWCARVRRSEDLGSRFRHFAAVRRVLLHLAVVDVVYDDTLQWYVVYDDTLQYIVRSLLRRLAVVRTVAVKRCKIGIIKRSDGKGKNVTHRC